MWILRRNMKSGHWASSSRLRFYTLRGLQGPRPRPEVQSHMTSTTPNPSLIQSVLRLSPRLAVFDCDGTLWSGDAGEGFFDWELKRGVVSDGIARAIRARYADYRAGKVSEDEMCGEMVTMHAGLREDEILRLSREFFDENFAGRIFPEMRQLVADLQK